MPITGIGHSQLSFLVALVLLNASFASAKTLPLPDDGSFGTFGPRPSPHAQQAQKKLEQLENSLEDARARGDRESEAQALQSIGLLHYSNEQFRDALDAFSGSLTLYLELNWELL